MDRCFVGLAITVQPNFVGVEAIELVRNIGIIRHHKRWTFVVQGGHIADDSRNGQRDFGAGTEEVGHHRKAIAHPQIAGGGKFGRHNGLIHAG